MGNRIATLAMAAFAALFYVACGSSGGTDSNDTQKISDADYEADSYKELPSCSKKREGTTAYVVDQEQGYVCEDGKWVEDDSAVEIVGSSSSKKSDKSSSSFKSVIDTVITVDPETGDTIVSLDTLAGIDSTLRKCAPEFDDKYMTYNGMTYRCYDDFWRPEKNPPKDSNAQVICLKTTDPNAPLKCYLDTAIWSSSSYVADPEDFVDQGVIKIKDGSITGVAQKGPYLQGSTYRIIPLEGKTLKPTGDTLSDQFNNSKGTYTFCDLNLPSQYAMIEASGYYRSELTGNKSNLQMTIGAIVDVQKGANINMITNLEYERVKYLVQNEGYNIAGAKKRALTEVLSAFHIENVTGSAEQLDITQDGEANGALLAISIMIQGVAEVSFNMADLMMNFRNDFKEDGLWNEDGVKIKIADIAYEADSMEKLQTYRRNISDWGLGHVPNFEKYIKGFWENEFGLGKCSESRYGEVKKNQNSRSKRFESYFICDIEGMESYNSIDLDMLLDPSYQNEIKSMLEQENVNYYWRVIKPTEYNTKSYSYKCFDMECAKNIQPAITISGDIDKNKYYTCACIWKGEQKDGQPCSAYDKPIVVGRATVSTCRVGWREATEEEKNGPIQNVIDENTNGQNCSIDGLIIPGVVDPNKYFYCEKTDGYEGYKWRMASSLEVDKYYSECNSNTPDDGKLFLFSDSNYYTCDTNGIRMATSTDVSMGLACVAALEGKASVSPINTPIICKKGKWTFNGNYGSVEDQNGKEYKTIQIGSQTWMAEDLGERNYVWGGDRDICPKGWHVPDTSEWRILFKSIGNVSATLLNESVNIGTNSYGFSASGSIYWSRNYSHQSTSIYYDPCYVNLTGFSSSCIGGGGSCDVLYNRNMLGNSCYQYPIRCIKD